MVMKPQHAHPADEPWPEVLLATLALIVLASCGIVLLYLLNP